MFSTSERAFGLVAIAAVAALSASAGPAAASQGAGLVASEITVRPGDTLITIAGRHGVGVDDLRSWNKRRIGEGDVIRVGDKLVIMVHPDQVVDEGEEHASHYRIRRGDTLGGIAEELGVDIAMLRHWNDLGRGSVIRAGDILEYRKPGERPPARSLGRPTKGTLAHGVHLGEGEGYRLRFPRNAYGIERVNATLRRCAAEVHRANPGTADILIGDISRPGGGRFPPHASHQSGRDVDVGYYIDGNVQNKTMYRLRPHEVDYAKSWALLRCFLRRDRVVRVYMDRGMQRKMAHYVATERRASADLVARLFEVEGGEGALIRHAPKHDTHIHVRFACEQGAKGCREDPGDTVFKL